MESINRYLDAITKCELSGDSSETYCLNGLSPAEYDTTMEDLYLAFKVELLGTSFSVPEFIAITRKIEYAKKHVEDIRKEVSKKTNDNIVKGYSAITLFRSYSKFVDKTAELVENINIMKLAQAATPPQNSSIVIKDVQSEPSANDSSNQEERASLPTSAPDSEKEERRSFNDKAASHPGEYWGYKELEAGEGISHATAWKIVNDSYYLPAIRFVGRNLRVDIDILHSLQKQRTADRKKPIGNRPQRKKKTPTQ